MKRSLGLVGVVLAALLATASPAAADTFKCNSLNPVTGTFDDVVVPRDGACTLVNSTVQGDVRALRNSFFESTNTSIDGNVKGKEAQTLFVNGGSTIQGRVRGDETAQVFLFDSTVSGKIKVTEASDVVNICGMTVERGNIEVRNSGTDILVGDPDPLVEGCAGNKVQRGDVEVERNFTDVELVIRGNTISRGDLEVNKNRGPSDKFVIDNTGGQDLECKGNSDKFEASGNTGWDKKEGQCD